MYCANCAKRIDWIAISEEVMAEKNIIFCNKTCMLNKFAKMYSGLIDDLRSK